MLAILLLVSLGLEGRGARAQPSPLQAPNPPSMIPHDGAEASDSMPVQMRSGELLDTMLQPKPWPLEP